MTNWQNQFELSCPIIKCRYLQKEREEGQVPLNGQVIPKGDKELYVGMIVEAGGLGQSKSDTRAEDGGRK